MNGTILPTTKKRCAAHVTAEGCYVLGRINCAIDSTYIRSVESLLLVGDDGDVGSGVSHAGQHEALAHLVVIKERLVGLVDASGVNLAGARRASSGAARVGQVNACRTKKKRRVVNI